MTNHKKDDDYEDDEEEEEGEDDSSSWADLKQHAVAVLIAVLAAILGYYYQLQSKPQDSISLQDPTASLEMYQRTSGVHFCPDPPRPKTSGLVDMQVRIPERMWGTLEQFYRADVIHDDRYERMDETSAVSIPYSEYECFLQQQHGTELSSVVLTTFVYKTPTIASIAGEATEGETGAKVQAASLSFTGFVAQFVNLSAKPVLLHWEDHRNSATKLVAEIGPMERVKTTLMTPAQDFYVSPVYDSSTALKRWLVTADSAALVYENFDTEKESSVKFQEMYQMHQLNLLYGRDYKVLTGRPWLGMFPHARGTLNRPSLWEEATQQYQEFAVESEAHHIMQALPQPSSSPPLKLKLTVASVAPKVLVMDNFLSDFECEHLKELSMGLMHESTVVGGSEGKEVRDEGTRSSQTAILPHKPDDTIMSTVYRRAADVVRMDVATMMAQHQAEPLQVVHYGPGQEYTAHHDFVVPPTLDRFQPSRAATLLMYLNTPAHGGGETFFPMAVQTKRHDGISFKPKRGKAVLFYNVLPDGNADPLAVHGSRPMRKDSEKWVANLWVWDPFVL